MEILILIALGTFFYDFAVASDDNFSAVVSYSLWDYFELDQLYERMQNRRESYSTLSATTPRAKEHICQQITNSRHFFIMGTAPIEINQGLYQELKSHYYSTWIKLYVKASPIRRYELYVNRTREIEVAVKTNPKSISEYAFLCVARNRKTKRIQEYYVSEPYNLNEAFNWMEKRIIGRFVFVSSNGKYSIRALAEQPATAAWYYIEGFYLRTRKNYKPETVADDALCRLTKLEKVRVCSSVLNSSYFHSKIRYSSRSDFIYDCKKMEVSFRTDDAKSEANGTYYEEWMLWCLAEAIESDVQTEYFVSRAYHPNHVFIYSRDYLTREMYLENLSTDISVVVC